MLMGRPSQIGFNPWIKMLNNMQTAHYLLAFRKTSKLVLLSCGLLCGPAIGALIDPVVPLPLTQVSASVYVAIGDTGPPTYETARPNVT